jgi:hypothetical protein
METPSTVTRTHDSIYIRLTPPQLCRQNLGCEPDIKTGEQSHCTSKPHTLCAEEMFKPSHVARRSSAEFSCS